MERLETYSIVSEDEVIATTNDFLKALRQSRVMAEQRYESLEIRDASGVILAVSLSTKKADAGFVMQRAARHNNQLLLTRIQEERPLPRLCNVTQAPHSWQFEEPRHLRLFRCKDCNVLGYRTMPKKFIPHRCSVCGEPATHIRPNKRVSHHRWSCANHADL